MQRIYFPMLFFFICLILSIPVGVCGQSVTRALVIGISDYQDEKIPDLKFADRDAEAFVAFLKSEAGGSLPDEQIKLLTNDKASAAQIFSAMDWLIDESKEKDKVLVYFSGHGDVETKTVRQRGYLLAHDTPSNNYRIGAVSLGDLNDILATISEGNKAQVVLITDACHSGNLAGKAINGTQATATALMNQFANEVKIMSCQPDELSLEGTQWGGGRGLFSYHLLDGLTGLADKDENAQVNLREIERYLEDNVSREAAPSSQIPMTFGNKNTRISFVDDEALAKLKETKMGDSEMIASVDRKSANLELILEQDSSLLELYAEFSSAIEEEYFLPEDQSEGRLEGKSASELYDILSQEEALEPVHNLMKRNFAAALQDKSQQSIIAYLNVDPEEMKKRYLDFGASYQSNPAYLKKAASLLGEAHYLFDNLKTKQYYFKGLILRLNADYTENPKSALYDSAFVAVQKALQFDDQAAYVYNELGYINYRKRLFKEAISFFDSAMVKAPTWALPLANHAKNYAFMRKYEEADSMGRKALELKPDFYGVYNTLGLNFENRNMINEAVEMYLTGLQFDSSNLEMNNNLGVIYFEKGEYDAARKYFEIALREDSTYIFGHFNTAVCYVNLGDREKAIVKFKKCIELKPEGIESYIELTYQYMYLEQFENALQVLNTINEKWPENKEYHFGLTCWNALQGNINPALEALEKAFQNGLGFDRVEYDSDIDALRDQEGYKNLIKEYFQKD